MDWILVAAVLGGFVVGFMAGASRVPTGGNTAAAVAALLLGLFALFGKDAPQAGANLGVVGKLFTVFLVCLIVTYVGANMLRDRGWLKWTGIG